jgi:hypothetical protein
MTAADQSGLKALPCDNSTVSMIWDIESCADDQVGRGGRTGGRRVPYQKRLTGGTTTGH